jgi:phytoene dehydrogenase-like protein
VEFARTGDDLTQLEKAFDAAKYGRWSESPVLDIHVPTVSNPDLAPRGHAVASVLVYAAPYHLHTPWDDEQRRRLGDAVVSTLECYAPGVSRAIVAREVLSPLDLEARYGLVAGHLYHGDHSLDQLVLRPVLECARYGTPISGLYLCGSGSHPGGGITCAPGSLAAAAILQEWRP